MVRIAKEIAPRLTRVAVMFNPLTAPYVEYYLKPLEAAALKVDVKSFKAPVQTDADIEAIISKLGRDPSNGLIAMTDIFMAVHRKKIIELTAQYKIPLMYYLRDVPVKGGLISYGIHFIDQFQKAASYVDRVLRGSKPVDLPVQVPTKYELVINLKTAKTLGLTIPQSILILADELIE